MTRYNTLARSEPAGDVEETAYKLARCHSPVGLIVNVMFTCAHDGLLLDYRALPGSERNSFVIGAYRSWQPDINRDARHTLNGQRRSQPWGPLTAQNLVDDCPMEAQKTGSFALIQLAAPQPFGEPLPSVHHADTVGGMPADVKPE